ncbi:Uncharacterised protein [Mycobacteroides abscessus subsp. abscessus]|nr:Uncharacterised protein [Mycobacteroides abscessus subsp. abscessus]SIG51917.1 Uncharacterised protein [Mycobacteroides abscessus subsp. abscessus]SIG82355.1 Uncharacterised protein [Mycobacteroides abscessus subsp. abscessus]
MLLSVGVNLAEKSSSRGFSCGQSVAASRRRRAEPVVVGEHRAWRWGGSGSYERVVWVPESRSGTGEMGRGGLLRTGFRAGSGRGVRAVLGYMEKGVPSRLYRRVPSPKIKGVGNLTGGLTEPLTSCLTGVLTAGLTESRDSEGRAGGEGVRSPLKSPNAPCANHARDVRSCRICTDGKGQPEPHPSGMPSASHHHRHGNQRTQHPRYIGNHRGTNRPLLSCQRADVPCIVTVAAIASHRRREKPGERERPGSEEKKPDHNRVQPKNQTAAVSLDHKFPITL